MGFGTRLDEAMLGQRVALYSPENTMVLPPGEYEATVYCVCPWEVLLSDIRGVNGTELPRPYRTGNLRVAVIQPEKPEGLNPNCSRHADTSHRRRKRGGRRKKPTVMASVKKRRPSLSRGRKLRRKDGTEVQVRQYK